MVKVKVLSRSSNEFFRETKQDLHVVQRNADPKVHPFEKAREYTRAVNAAKLDKVFAKPFVAALGEHTGMFRCT